MPGPHRAAASDAVGALAMALSLTFACAVIVALHGHVLLYPFLEDDYLFISEAGRGLAGSLTHAFNSVGSYFRPVSRELYFWTLLRLFGQNPLAFHLVNFGLLATTLLAVALIGRRLAGLRTGLLAAAFYSLFYPHRVTIGYASCAQDLLATALACGAVLAHLRGSRWLAGVAYLLALLSKESVAPLPIVLTAWEMWSRFSRGAPRWRPIFRETWPMWLAAGLWLIGVLGLRSWFADPDVRQTVIPGADLSITAAGLANGVRVTFLTMFGLEQPSSLMRPAWLGLASAGFRAAVGVGLAATLPILVLALTRRPELAMKFPGGRDRLSDLSRLGILWLLIASVPPILLGMRFNAYYVGLPAIGLAWLVAGALARAPGVVTAAVFALCATTNIVANGAPVYRLELNDTRLPVGVSMASAPQLAWEASYVRTFRTFLLEDPPPRGAVIYLDQPFGYRMMGTSGERAPRLWLSDPSLDLGWSDRDGWAADRRPKRFLRFDLDSWSLIRIPDSVMYSNFEGIAALKQGLYPEAREALRRALRISRPGIHDNERGLALGNLGMAYLLSGDTAAARAAWFRALPIRSGRRLATLGLAALDEMGERYDGAGQWLKLGVAHDPDDVGMLHLLSVLERKTGRTADGEASWRRVETINPHYADSVVRAQGYP
ncbi:MAG: tetratricopeptide repeat protein [Candidatus Eisenbacteria bacterium]